MAKDDKRYLVPTPSETSKFKNKKTSKFKMIRLINMVTDKIKTLLLIRETFMITDQIKFPVIHHVFVMYL